MTSARFLRHETILAVLTVIALFVLAMLSDKFFTGENLLNQGRLMSEVGLVALAMTFVIVTGGIDLSVGSILGLTAILLGVFWKNLGLPLPAAIVLAMACGTFAGFVNGWIITRFNVPPLIATLATLALYRGLAEGISEARSVRGYPEWFFFFGQGEVLGVPFQLWILGIATVISAVILGLTPFGRATYAIGANEVAARFSGIRVNATKAVDLFRRRLSLGAGRGDLRLARHHHALRHGHGPRTRRHHRCRAWRHLDLRWQGHHHRHGAGTHSHPGPQERPGAFGREGRRHHRRHRIGSDRRDPRGRAV